MCVGGDKLGGPLWCCGVIPNCHPAQTDSPSSVVSPAVQANATRLIYGPSARHAALGERQLRASMKRLERKYSAVDKRSDKRRPAALSSLLHLCFTGVDGKQTAAVLVLASLSCTLHRSRPLSGLRSSARRCLIYLPSLRTLTWLTQAPFSPNIT